MTDDRDAMGHPKGLREDPAPGTGSHRNQGNQDARAPDDGQDDQEVSLPVHPAISFLLSPIFRKRVTAGTCCTGVAALVLITSSDHGLIQSMPSSFAKADDLQAVKKNVSSVIDDVSEMYVLQLGRTIRELQYDWCVAKMADRKKIDDQIDEKQQKYKARTGARYPDRDCRDL